MILVANKKDLKQAKRVAKKWASVDMELVIAYGEGKDDKAEEIAKAMLKKIPELSMKKISEITGLSIENIEELKNS